MTAAESSLSSLALALVAVWMTTLVRKTPVGKSTT